LVQDTINDNKVTIFSKSYCPYCKSVKQLFASEFPDVKPTIYEYVSLITGEGFFAYLASCRLDKRDDGADIQEYLYQKTGQRTVPNVFISECQSAQPCHFFH
jgi:glutaredoxin 3